MQTDEKLIDFGVGKSMFDALIDGIPSPSVNAETDDDKLLTFGEVKGMFAKYKELAPSGSSGGEDIPKPPEGNLPIFDEAAGRYTNESIVDWMNSFADGLVYGVKLPRYSYSQSCNGEKIEANAGLTLEPSTNDTAGRNDYENKKLFFCPRVHGGVDIDGMPYITSIEGLDNRFDSRENNTWALTPVYYMNREASDTHLTFRYSDTARGGYEACVGAYTEAGEERPYILRACYPCSNPTSFDSKSGTTPTGVCHDDARRLSLNNQSDGLTFLTLADSTYLVAFAQLMLGRKGFADVMTGVVSNSYSSDYASKVVPTGTLDEVQGTFGGITLESMTDCSHPFRFQNIEFGHGAAEVFCDAYAMNGIVWQASMTQNPEIFTTSTDLTREGYVGDFDYFKGFLLPVSRDASSTTGCTVRACASGMFGSTANLCMGYGYPKTSGWSEGMPSSFMRFSVLFRTDKTYGTNSSGSSVANANAALATRVSAIGRSAFES